MFFPAGTLTLAGIDLPGALPAALFAAAAAADGVRR
jgi:hypothetical protein